MRKGGREESPEGKRGSLMKNIRKMLVKFQTSKGNNTFLEKDVFEPSPIPGALHEQ